MTFIETREVVKVQDKLLHGFEFMKSTLRIFEREDGTYLFEWKKGWKRQHRPRIFDIIIGKFLCDLENGTGELACQIYKYWGEFEEESDLGKKYKIEQDMKRSGRALLPYLTGGGDLELEGLYKAAGIVIGMIRMYWRSQDPNFLLEEEKDLLKRFGASLRPSINSG